jgi:hypothetical protein
MSLRSDVIPSECRYCTTALIHESSPSNQVSIAPEYEHQAGMQQAHAPTKACQT